MLEVRDRITESEIEVLTDAKQSARISITIKFKNDL
jgi:hypothetical protein